MMKSTNASRSSKTSESSKSTIEKINIEAKEALERKALEIQKNEELIKKLETDLAKLQAQEKSKRQYFESVADSDSDKSDDSNDEGDIAQLKADQEAEIQQAKANHEEELQRLQAGYANALKEAEEWIDDHVENIFTEKKAELESYRKELDGLKATANESAFAATQSRTKIFQQSKSISLQNAQRIQELDAQLSELSAITREELRDVRAKIDECFVAVDVREREHTNEIERYQREITQREDKYNAHLAILAEQFANEKQRLDQQLKAVTSKKANIERVLGQLEKHHETQLQTTLKDIERMKSSIYASQTRDDQSLTDTRSYVSQVQAMQRDCRHTEQEISLINNEIKELTEENKQLQNELKRLDTSISSRGARAKRA